MRRKLTKLDVIAEQLIKEKKGIEIYPYEYSFISTATALIWQEIKNFYDQSDAGVSPPTPNAVKQWFYNGCPSWVIATLLSRTRKRPDNTN